MSKSTTGKAEDTLNIQNNAEGTHNQHSTLIDRIQMQGTPFWQIKTEQGYFLVMGENVMTPIFQTEQQLDTYIQENHWDLCCLMVLTLIDKTGTKNTIPKQPTSL